MDPYIAETYQWLPKGILFYVVAILASLLIYVAKRLANKIHDDIMKSIQELSKSVSGINQKLESFDAKITDIQDKLNQQVNLDRYIRDSEKIWSEIHYLKERNMILEHIVKLEQSR